jgi:hypothetical protein
MEPWLVSVSVSVWVDKGRPEANVTKLFTSVIYELFVPARHFQPSLMFVRKAGVCLSKAPFGYSTLWLALGLMHKDWTRQERPAREKHSSLLRKSVNYGRKKSYNVCPRWGLYYKSFYACNKFSAVVSWCVLYCPNHFHPSLIFAGNSWSLPKRSPWDTTLTHTLSWLWW